MTTPYCDKNYWAQRKGYDDWDSYDKDYPDGESLDNALEDSTDIMNDIEHIGCLSSNITDTDYTSRLKRICYNMANRILSIELAQGMQGAGWSFSPQDFLYERERKVLINLGVIKEYRKVGGIS